MRGTRQENNHMSNYRLTEREADSHWLDRKKGDPTILNRVNCFRGSRSRHDRTQPTNVNT